MTTKTKKPAASKKPAPKKLDAAKVLGAKSVKVETNAKGEIRKIETKPTAKPAIGQGSPKLDRTLERAAAKETTPATPAAPSKPSMKAAGKKPEGEPRLTPAPDDARIQATFTTPPGRPGSVVYRTRQLFLTSKTVGAFREAARAADLDLGYLRTDERRGLIKILPAAPAKEPKAKPAK